MPDSFLHPVSLYDLKVTKKPLVVIDDAIPDLEPRLREVADVVALPGREITPEDVCCADALVVRTRTKCDRRLLEGSSVRLVATATAGTDHIDSEWCRAHGITVRSAAGCNAPAVAQYVLSSLLHTGFDPSADVLGVVGKGNVGSIVTDWARGLGIRVLVSDPPRQARGEDDEEYLSFPDLLKRSDAVTFHVPLISEGDWPTLGMFGLEETALLKPDAVIINAARGGVMDENAVLRRFGGRGTLIVDTWEGEPAVNRKLLSEAFISTPHIAGYSREGKQRATRMVIEALNDFFRLNAPLDGLAPGFEKSQHPSARRILESYDPVKDSARLKEAPHRFEALRNGYALRSEP